MVMQNVLSTLFGVPKPTKDTHPLETALDRLREQAGLLYYEPHEFDLSVARTDHLVQSAGDVLLVAQLTGTMSGRFNEIDNPLIDFGLVRRVITPFERFYLTNTAQAGKVAVFYIGRDASFLAEAIGATKILNSSGVEIDPAITSQFYAIEKANEHNTAELADTDILAAALIPTNTPCLFRAMVSFNAAGIFKVTITKAANTQTLSFNGGANLTADCVYIFDHLVHSGDTINYQYSAAATLRVLRVQEMPVGAQ